MEKTTEINSSLRHVWPNSEEVHIAVKTSSTPDNSKLSPGFIWLGGFKSDMTGTKAQAMVEQASALNCSSVRFDYSGHGTSGGQFSKGTISRWVDESLHVVLEKASGPQIFVGSSMGGWIALRLVQELKKQGQGDRLAGLLLIAPAPDFTQALMEPQFSEEQKAALINKGYFEEPSEYSDEPNLITRDLIEDGRKNLVLDSNTSMGVPVRILQGMEDSDVPYSHALQLVQSLPDDDIAITLVKGGDHRLSRPEDIALLKRTMTTMAGQ